MTKKVIKITIELTEDATPSEASELAEAVLTGIRDYEPEYSTSGDLRRLVKSYGYYCQPKQWANEKT